MKYTQEVKKVFKRGHATYTGSRRDFNQFTRLPKMKQVSKYNFGIFFPYHVYNAVVGTAEVYKDKIDP